MSEPFATDEHEVTQAFVDQTLIVADIIGEIEKACRKFPQWPNDPLHAAMVIGEEAGEISKAVLQACYEPHKATPEDVRMECIQTAAMCIRFLISMPVYQFKPGLQHDQVLSELLCTFTPSRPSREILEAGK